MRGLQDIVSYHPFGEPSAHPALWTACVRNYSRLIDFNRAASATRGSGKNPREWQKRKRRQNTLLFRRGVERSRTISHRVLSRSDALLPGGTRLPKSIRR